jgi:hypothetical protein
MSTSEAITDPYVLAERALAAYVAEDKVALRGLMWPDATDPAPTFERVSALKDARIAGLYWLEDEPGHIAAVVAELRSDAGPETTFFKLVQRRRAFYLRGLERDIVELYEEVSG